MTNKSEGKFAGFSPTTLDFLIKLKEHNNKPWFTEHRQEYLEFVLSPMQDLVEDLSAFMLSVDPYFETRPAVSKTIPRIYRDTRFSKDKSPYRSSIWFTFKRPGPNWQDAPVWFFEVAPEGYSYGMGYYGASKDTMDRLREKIDENPEEFFETVAFYYQQQDFVLEGETYKRILDSSKSEKILDWYQRRNLYLICRRGINERLFDPALVNELISGFSTLVPFYHYLRGLKEEKR